MRLILLASFLGVLLGLQPAAAGTLEIGIKAYSHGDHRRAFAVLKPLAQRGNAVAQFNVGLMYDEGKGVPQSFSHAFKWYARAAENGLIEAQYTVGYFHRWGRGMKQNVVKAHMWLNLAASGGVRHAGEERYDEEQVMTGAQIAKAQELAVAWRASHPRVMSCGPRQCPRPRWLPKADWYSPFYWRGL